MTTVKTMISKIERESGRFIKVTVWKCGGYEATALTGTRKRIIGKRHVCIEGNEKCFSSYGHKTRDDAKKMVLAEVAKFYGVDIGNVSGNIREAANREFNNRFVN